MEDEIEPYREEEGHRNGVGRTEGRGKERRSAGLTGRNSSCNSRSRIALGPSWWEQRTWRGHSEREREREIIITRIRRLVRARRPSAEFGHVARVPRPHHRNIIPKKSILSVRGNFYAPVRTRFEDATESLFSSVHPGDIFVLFTIVGES